MSRGTGSERVTAKSAPRKSVTAAMSLTVFMHITEQGQTCSPMNSMFDVECIDVLMSGKGERSTRLLTIVWEDL